MPKKDKPASLSTFSFLVLSCFLFSGMAGLIYQIVWLRLIDKVIGSAPFAVATVLSVFMGGLALGSWLAGKYIDRIASKRDLLSLYGVAEIIIGAYGHVGAAIDADSKGDLGKDIRIQRRHDLKTFDDVVSIPVFLEQGYSLAIHQISDADIRRRRAGGDGSLGAVDHEV